VSKRRSVAKPANVKTPEPVSNVVPDQEPAKSPVLTRLQTGFFVVALLGLHYAIAADSLRRENPTVDEIAHMPAGLSYWEKGTFKLYHHNPPLTKLIASLPVLMSGATTADLYQTKAWNSEPPRQDGFGEIFAFLNASRYFELFTLSRLVMPMFSLLGGLFIFLWSSQLYGRVAGLLSLAVWCLCPNILAHARLVTGDVAGASMGLAATYVFWRYLRRPTWLWAIGAGLILGLAQLTKFSLLLLYGYWPLIWLARILIERDFINWQKRLMRDASQGLVMVAISLFVICAGYGFEGVGKPLGSFEFASASLTRPITPAELAKGRPVSANPAVSAAWRFRINRFRSTFLAALPSPLPSHFLLGFDDQRLETEALPEIWFDPNASPKAKTGYPVYLDGVLRRTGWWYYYLLCMAYKIPEGTWLLIAASLVGMFMIRKNRNQWFDEAVIMAFPAIVLFAMSALTDINLGLRYVLPIFPFLYVSIGKVVPWVASKSLRFRKLGSAFLGISLGLTIVQTALIHPSYLANFNWVSGGPGRGSEHLIDSNLDWGQDLVTLRHWVTQNRPGQAVGLAYFGQINPTIFLLRDEEFRWFLPPTLPGTVSSMRIPPDPGPADAASLKPGIYAVSASMVRGLPFRLFESGDPRTTWQPSWNDTGSAFTYFAELKPIAKVGYSIFVYELNQADCDRLNPRFTTSPRR
jgi:hypothetical protein